MIPSLKDKIHSLEGEIINSITVLSAVPNNLYFQYFKQCYTAEQVLKIYDIEEGKTIDKNKFKDICPSLIQQLDSGVCKTPTTTGSSSSDPSEDDWRRKYI